MKIIIAGLLVFTFNVSASWAQEPVDPRSTVQVVAEINGAKITKAEIEQSLRKELRGDLEDFDEAERHVLFRSMMETMVDRKLLLQSAKKQNLIPDKQQISGYLESLRSKLREEGELERQLEKYGVKEEDFLSHLKEELAIKEYLDLNVFSNLNISEDEILSEYNTNAKHYADSEEVRARHIMFKVTENAEAANIEEIRLQAIAVLKKAKKSDADFEALARKYSQASNSGKGGDLGFFTKNQMPGKFAEKAFELAPGEVGGLIQTEHGFHIIKVEERRGGGVPKLEGAVSRIKAGLLRDKRKKLLKEHMEQLRKNNKVILYYR